MQKRWKCPWSWGIVAALACAACRGDQAALNIHVLDETSKPAVTRTDAMLILVPDEIESQLSLQAARKEGAARGNVPIEVAETIREQFPDLCSDPSSTVELLRVPSEPSVTCGPTTLCTQPPKPPKKFRMYLALCDTPDIQ